MIDPCHFLFFFFFLGRPKPGQGMSAAQPQRKAPLVAQQVTVMTLEEKQLAKALRKEERKYVKTRSCSSLPFILREFPPPPLF